MESNIAKVKQATEGLNSLLKAKKEELKLTMQLEEAKKQERRKEIFAEMIKIMRTKGASEQSIQIASRGLREYINFVFRPVVAPVPDRPEKSQPDPGTVEKALDKGIAEVRKDLMQFKRAKAPRPKTTRASKPPTSATR